MPINKDTFCIFRWDQSVVNFSSSEIRTCCRTVPKTVTEKDITTFGEKIFLNSDYLLERRKEMLEGKKHSDCRECWEMEDKGLQSFRKTQFDPNESTEAFLERVSGSDPASFHFSNNPHSLILFIGNTCDLKCLYCGSSLSTSWAKEDLKFGVINEDTYKRITTPAVGFDDVFWEWFENKKESLGHISFVGGEPLFMPKFYTFLERISEAYKPLQMKHKLTLNITSNLNAQEKTFNQFVAALKKLNAPFFEIKIDGSIDSTDESAGYIRSGISWERWKKNFTSLLELKDINIKMTVIPSISALSVSSFGKLIQELADMQAKYGKKIHIQENLIMTPPFLSPFILTPDFADHLEKTLPVIKSANLETERAGQSYGEFVERVMQTIRKGDEGLASSKYRRDFLGFIQKMDGRRETDFLKVFPEMREFFELCQTGQKAHDYDRGIREQKREHEE